MKELMTKAIRRPVVRGLIPLMVLFQASIVPAQQRECTQKYLSSIPADLVLKEDRPQEYLVTTDYFNGDLYGNFLNKTRVQGVYTRGLPNGKVKWNQVSIATGNTRNEPCDPGVFQEYMEDFTYTPSADMVKPTAFSAFPVNSFHTKNLVWDLLGIEGFAWCCLDSLRLNEVFDATSFNGAVDLAGQGTFENKDVELKWVGISKMNGEICALIDYRTFDNPLSVDTEQFRMKGRSHYWGTIWVSLTDRQIEYALLYEDVIMEMVFNGDSGQWANTTRVITVEKHN